MARNRNKGNANKAPRPLKLNRGSVNRIVRQVLKDAAPQIVDQVWALVAGDGTGGSDKTLQHKVRQLEKLQARFVKLATQS